MVSNIFMRNGTYPLLFTGGEHNTVFMEKRNTTDNIVTKRIPAAKPPF